MASDAYKAAVKKRRIQQARDAESRRLRDLEYDSYIDLYRERVKSKAATKKELERLAREYFGAALIVSAALALDPISALKFTLTPVVKVNRFRKIVGISGESRSYTYTTPNSTIAYSTTHGVSNPDFVLRDDTPKGSSALVAQENIDGFLNDTSYASRKTAIKTGVCQVSTFQGEMELYVPNLRTTPWHYTWRERDNVSISDSPPISTYHARSIKDHYTVVKGPSQRITKSSHDTWYSNYRTTALALLSKQTPALISKCLPTSRSFNLAYNVAELKDLPRLLRETLQRLRHLEEFLKSASNTGSAYLEYKFAWESTYRAVLDMLKLPMQISKRINYLLKRNGKFTTLHYSRHWSEPLSSSPSFQWEIYPFDVALDTSSIRGVHNVELRCAINSRIVLPHVDVPKLKEQLFWELIGANPRPSDLYNLIPWTWLVDWFGGIGDYISMMETIYNDPSLINYGFVSYVGRGEIVSALNLKADGSSITAIAGNPSVTVTTKYRPSRNASFFWKYHYRRSVIASDGVRLTAVPSTLTNGQAAIITALATKTKKST